jgi:VIT1/CCC1 family predicted Fe2+/Mn2+ transporter
MRHGERHRTHRTGWLRAAVLGANDGIVSTASLVLGVAAAGARTQAIVVAGVAGLVAGAMSMAAGEYVSVSSQADTESADLARESKELAQFPEQEHAELTAIYVERGLEESLASSVATQLMQHDALAAHGRDELGISDTLAAKPVHAADGSCASSFRTYVGSRRELPFLSCALGFSGCTRRGRTCDRLHYARHFLGGSRDGIDGRSRGSLWRCHLRSRVSGKLTPDCFAADRLRRRLNGEYLTSSFAFLTRHHGPR